MRVYATTSSFKVAAAAVDIDALLLESASLPDNVIDTQLIRGFRCVHVRFTRGGTARIFPNGTVMISDKNVERVTATAKDVAALMMLPPTALRRNNAVPTVVRAMDRVKPATFQELLEGKNQTGTVVVHRPYSFAGVQVRRDRDSAATVFRNGKVNLMVKIRSNKTGKQVQGILKASARQLV